MKKRKVGRESPEHENAKLSIGYILHKLGFKVFVEQTLEVKGRSVRPDIIAIKDKVAIVVEVGQLQYRPITFEDLYNSVKQEFREFKLRHVILCNPLIGQFDYLLNIDPSEYPQILEEIARRKEPDRTLHLRER